MESSLGKIGHLTKVEEELSENVEGEERVAGEMFVVEAHDEEKEGKDYEAHELDGLASNDINSSNCEPVSGHSASEDNDQVTNSRVVP